MPTVEHPYGDLTGGEWLRGNLHTHSTQSDGADTPQAVIDAYARYGYGFLALSDHDRLTTEADYRQWESRGLVLIPAMELGGGPHLLYVDGERPVAVRASRQEILNEIQAATRATGRGLAIVTHPDWEAHFDHCTIGQLREWTGYVGMEIYNGSIVEDDGSPYALSKWDRLLGTGRRVWGFANDDTHHPDRMARGWNTAYVKERSVRGVVEALRAGRFYASTGVTITSLEVDGMMVRIETENAQRINAIQNVGRCVGSVDGTSMAIRIPESAHYLRFECWGAGEAQAWTQPFFVPIEQKRGEREQAFLQDWTVSCLLPHRTLAEASADEGRAQARTPASAHPPGHAAAGLLDVRQQILSRAGVVYLAAEYEAPRAGRGVVKLGYDGPIRAWWNGTEIFCGPGTNPAVADELQLYAAVQAGRNRLLLALDSHDGNAWGVFARVAMEE